MHARFGTLPWVDLFAPAITLASQGHRITSYEAARLNLYQDAFRKFNHTDIPFVRENVWEAGDLLVQEDLAKTLTVIARQGASVFYNGLIADLIVREMQSAEGLITHEDLAAFTAVWRTPLVTPYKDYHIYSMPPPSSGGLSLLQLFGIAERYPLSAWGRDDIRTLHLMVEAERRAFADRAEYLGDPDFVRVPADSLLDSAYLLRRMADFDMQRASLSAKTGPSFSQPLPETYETTHTNVMDPFGNVVAVTTTLNTNFGCKVMVDGAGFFLNSEMDDFTVKPGVPNTYGLVGTDVNAIEPGKRMVSSMTPTIVTHQGRFLLAVGTPGGSTIITSVFQTILNVIEFGMTASESVAAKRFHHQWLPDEITYESGRFSDRTLDSLSMLGHSLRPVKHIGTVEMILAWPNGLIEGAADPRESDHAAGPNL